MNLEQELVRSVANGNKKGFEILFRTYYKRLCAYAVGFVSQNDIAEDLVTDVFLNFWEKRESLTIHKSVSSYLFQSVKNSCINYLNREKSRKHIISENEAALLALKIKYPVSDKYPLTDLIGRELEEKIKAEIEKLPEQCREIFYLSRFEERSHKEIADQLGISENTVKVQIYRALIKLRVGLKDYLPILILQFPEFF
ncbi:MAG: RNA polymerase sigma-70 factor [Prolixibacteraceae bacterium]|jgi:RNA polymerase sigma-70 factor (ECF subfamily)|nr:RNA polymerase sigma-70 factor [Prolixibacteraceae bacterium]